MPIPAIISGALRILGLAAKPVLRVLASGRVAGAIMGRTSGAAHHVVRSVARAPRPMVMRPVARPVSSRFRGANAAAGFPPGALSPRYSGANTAASFPPGAAPTQPHNASPAPANNPPPGPGVPAKTDNRVESPGRFSNFTNLMWGYQSLTQNVALLNTAFPQAIHSVVVQVKAGPQADLRRAWQLCTAAAFGRYRRGPNFNMATSRCTYEAQWDITGKAVAFSITSQMGGLDSFVESNLIPSVADLGAALSSSITMAQNALSNGWNAIAGGFVDSIATIAGAGPSAPPPTRGSGVQAARSNNQDPATSSLGFLLRGPDQETLGGTPPDIFRPGSEIGGVGRVIGGLLLPGDRDAKEGIEFVPDTAQYIDEVFGQPDVGRLITSGFKYDPQFQNPTPPRDQHSRANLVALVAAALTNEPAYLPASPPDYGFYWDEHDEQSSRCHNPNETPPFTTESFMESWSRRMEVYRRGDPDRKRTVDGYSTYPRDGTSLAGKDNQAERFERPDQERR